jgi:quinoprotein glucose dehydrogenase
MTRRTVESDICIIGSGITAALIAEKLTEERTARITVVEAGDHVTPLAERGRLRRRFLDYGENPWPGDHVDPLSADGIQSRSMCVGGLAMHWGAVTPRFTPEDFRLRSLYGVGDDWPMDFEDLDPFYQEAEERMGVAGEQGPATYDPRSAAYPQPPLPLSYNLQLLKTWGERSDIAFWSQPSAKNSVTYGGRPACCRSDTCSPICPIGAKYSPDFTWRRLTAAGAIDLLTRTVVRRLALEEGSDRVSHAIAMRRDRPEDEVQIHARTFVVACGYVWSPHLLLLSATSRFPAGLANRSGLVGKYMNGHRNLSAFIRLPLRLYPGMNQQHSLMSHQFMRPGRLGRYLRHDLRIWESSVGSEPRLRDDDGRVLLGGALLDDWRRRSESGAARVRAYYDVLPHRESRVTLDPERASPWGDPLPRIRYRDSDDSAALRSHTEDTISRLFLRMARAGGGEIIRQGVDHFQDHPGGGCRMGSDPATSVCDSHGRTHDHENLFVVGAPTCVTGSCVNATLTFVALGLRAATHIGDGFPARLAATGGRQGTTAADLGR